MYQTPYSILNFNCPQHLKQDIDEICKFRRISRTALINTFFERVVEEWKPRVRELQRQDQPKPTTQPLTWSIGASPNQETNEPLAIFSNEDDDAW
jgi:hypothetical protein